MDGREDGKIAVEYRPDVLEVALDRYFEEVLPEETIRLVEKARDRQGLPEGFRRFLDAFLEGEFDGHDSFVSMSLLVMAMALKPSGPVGADGPGPEFAAVLVAAVAGTDSLWRSFLGFPGNDRFAADPPAGARMAHMLRLDAELAAARRLIGSGALDRDAFAAMMEAAAVAIFRRAVAD